MRLLYLSTDPGVPVLGHKGASVHVRAMVSALAGAGAELIVASPRVEFEGEALAAPATLVEIDAVLPKAFPDVGALRAAVERQTEQVLALASELAVDGIYERLALFSVAGVRTASALAIPHVLEVNAPLSVEAARFRSLPFPEVAAEFERESLERTDRVLAVSATLAELLIASGVEAESVEVVPNGISEVAIRAVRPRRAARFTVGFAGSLKPWHGIELLLEAVANAIRVEPTLRLEIVGDGPLAGLVRASPLAAGTLEYRGQLTHQETLEAMAGWDVGAAPYPALDDFYFSPLKVGEYMACGACPVTSDLAVLRALLGGGDRGVLVPPGDATAFASAIVSLARDRTRAYALGERARAYAIESLDWCCNARRALAALAPLTGAVR